MIYHNLFFLCVICLLLQCRTLTSVKIKEHVVVIKPQESYNSNLILLNERLKVDYVKLKIASNLSTGYNWEIVNVKQNVEYKEYEYKDGLDNSTGYTVFKIPIDNKKDTIVQLIYQRSFDVTPLFEKFVIKNY